MYRNPKFIHEALQETNWALVMRGEMRALNKNGIQEIVNQPKEKKKKAVECKVYTLKYNVDGSFRKV